MTQIRIPHDSNLRYLPLVFFLPEDLIARCPTLRKLPRNLLEINQSKELIDLIGSDQFLNEIMDASAALAFPHFGFSGWKEHYTGYFPVWQLSYSLQIWAKFIEEETEWGLQAMFKLPKGTDIPFFNPEYIKNIFSVVVKRAIAELDLQPILDVVKQMPCEEDFEKRKTYAYLSFRRKWYHTRYYEKRDIKLVSYESCKEEVHQIKDNASPFEEDVESRDYVERFKALLSPKDKEIITLRAHGHTYEKIAEMLGYKNHSGVLKRLRAIREIFEEFEAQQSKVR
jgi:hypothetical protein